MKIIKNFILLIIFISPINFINSTHADWTNPSSTADVIDALGVVDSYRNSHGNLYTSGNSAANLIVNLITNTVTVTCDNGATSTEISLPPSEISALINTTTSLGYDEVLIAPPAPVMTSSTSTSNGCGSYVSSWTTTWSECSIEGTWSSTGAINCKQTPSFSANTSSCGSQECTTTYVDGVASGTSCSACSGCPGDASQPTTPPETKIISLNLNSPTSTCNSKYANNLDTCSVKVTVSGNTNDNKQVVNWGTNGTISNISDLSNEGSDRVNGGGKALNFGYIVNTGPINGKGDYYIDGIKSRSPFTINTGKIGLKVGGVDMTLNNIQYSFNKPLIGKIHVSGDNGLSWNALPTLGTLLEYKLSYDNIGTAVISNYLIENFVDKIFPTSNDLEIQNKSVSGSTLNENGTIFSSRINTSSDKLEKLPIAGLQVEKPIISYNLGGEIVKYFLSKNDSPNDITAISTSGEEFLGVKVIGTLQGDGKQTITGQKSNFSDIYSLNLRTSIREKAYKYISNMKSGDILAGVRYIEGGIVTISGEQNYETLIVKNGNVIINGDLNTSGKKLGIIVLKDSYDANVDYNTSGNIYINTNVAYVNALFYSDGGIISSKGGNPYINDTTSRTYELNKQLIIKGTLFTRNTIGGAILSGGYYNLPGNSKTSDFNKAMIYDLNYLRRGNSGCDKNGNINCNDNGEYKEPVVLIYDSNLSNTPPKLFGK